MSPIREKGILPNADYAKVPPVYENEMKTKLLKS
jgi:hypothetical protein